MAGHFKEQIDLKEGVFEVEEAKVSQGGKWSQLGYRNCMGMAYTENCHNLV